MRFKIPLITGSRCPLHAALAQIQTHFHAHSHCHIATGVGTGSKKASVSATGIRNVSQAITIATPGAPGQGCPAAVAGRLLGFRFEAETEVPNGTFIETEIICNLSRALALGLDVKTISKYFILCGKCKELILFRYIKENLGIASILH